MNQYDYCERGIEDPCVDDTIKYDGQVTINLKQYEFGSVKQEAETGKTCVKTVD